MHLLLVALLLVCGCSHSGYKTVWKRTFPEPVSTAIGAKGEVLFAGESRLIMLNPNGEEIWEIANPVSEEWYDWKLDGEVAYGLFGDGLIALKNEKVQWQLRIEDKGPHWHFVEDRLHNRLLIARGDYYDRGELWEISTAGKQVGRVALPGYFGNRPVVLDEAGRFYYVQKRKKKLVGENFVDLEPKDKLVCLDQDGSEAWRFPGDFLIAYDRPILLPNGNIALMNARGMWVLNRDGKLVTHDTSLRNWTSQILVSKKNRIYAVVVDGIVEVDQQGKELNRVPIKATAGFYTPVIANNGDIFLPVGQLSVRGKVDFEIAKKRGAAEPGMTALRDGNTHWEIYCISPELKVRWKRRIDDMLTSRALPNGDVLLRTGKDSFECLRPR
jgi:hypothetical protein